MESELPHRGSPPLNDGMSAARVVFPQREEDFADDVRVSLDAVNNKYVLEDDGKEYEWEPRAQKWIHLVCTHALSDYSVLYVRRRYRPMAIMTNYNHIEV